MCFHPKVLSENQWGVSVINVFLDIGLAYNIYIYILVDLDLDLLILGISLVCYYAQVFG